MNAIFPSLKPTKIYAFTEPQFEKTPWIGPNRKGEGLLKVGFTTRDEASRRIWDIFPTQNPNAQPFTVKFEEEAKRPNGIFFTDRPIHKKLVEMGIHRLAGEWFECTVDEVKAAFLSVRDGKTITVARNQTFLPRPEQEQAIKLTQSYFLEQAKNRATAPHFLWNAKMRFGKTFTAYKLAKEMGWKKILILTYKPAVQTAWKADLEDHIDFENWEFIYKKETPETPTNPIVMFTSLQDIFGKDKHGNTKPKFDTTFLTEWDCIIFDEYHYGAWKQRTKDFIQEEEEYTEEDILTQKAREGLKSKHFLYLSGTPFRALQNGEFTEDQIFHWTYEDEQREKQNWEESKGPNLYSELPKMAVMTYQMPEEVRQVAQQGELNEFNLGEFFLAEGKAEEAKFKHEPEVQRWLDIIKGGSIKDARNLMDSKRPPLPFEDVRLLPYLNHTVWLLPNVASCAAMKNLLQARQNTFYHGFEVINASGNQAGMGAEALPPVLNAMGNDPQKTKTITLTCSKLTTGVTVPAWTGIFMLQNLNSPETYFQSAFRVQSPWVLKNCDPTDPNRREILKETCYVFDFAPNRALAQIAEYNAKLNAKNDRPVQEQVEEFLKFLPVLCYDGASMKELDAIELLDIAISGTAATMLARKFQSPMLINLGADVIATLLENPDLIKTLEEITAHRNLNENFQKIINAELSLKDAKKNDRKPSEEEKKTGDEQKKKKESIRKLLIKFITRIPIFMYLTDHREEKLRHVIESVEPELFQRTTGIGIEGFKSLCDAGVFNEGNLSAAILAFRIYEMPSLAYIGGTTTPTKFGTLDGVVTFDEAKQLLNQR